MCVNLVKMHVSFIRSSCKEHRNKHREHLSHITAWMPARRSTLRNLRNVEYNLFVLPSIRKFRRSLQQLVFAILHTIQQLAAIQLLYKAIIAAQNETSCWFVPVFVACASQRHRRKFNSRSFTMNVKPLCQINALFPVRQRQQHQELKPCHQMLASGRSLDIVLGREPPLALDSLLHSNHRLDVEVLLHSTACGSTAKNHSNH